MNNEYWSDYTRFIKIVEDITGQSPADLINTYTMLVEELENSDKEDILEWVYENADEGYTRTKIQKIMDSKELSGNILLKEFEETINVLDARMEKFLKKSCKENGEWQKEFSPDLIDWDNIKKS